MRPTFSDLTTVLQEHDPNIGIHQHRTKETILSHVHYGPAGGPMDPCIPFRANLHMHSDQNSLCRVLASIHESYTSDKHNISTLASPHPCWKGHIKQVTKTIWHGGSGRILTNNGRVIQLCIP